MTAVLSSRTDRERLKHLWLQAFGGEGADEAGFDRAYSCCDGTYALCVGTEAVSSMLCYDLTVDGLRGFYIYALCTAEEHRHRGYMRMLVREVCRERAESGYSFAMLIPANEALCASYTKMGFDCRCPLLSAPSIRGISDIYGFMPQPPSLLPFDGDYSRLYSMSQRHLSEAAFVYSLSTLEMTRIFYTADGTLPHSFVICAAGDHRRIAAAGRDMHGAVVLRQSASALYIRLSTACPPHLTSAEPLMR